ncbi:helix-turn-helix domain-containing protein [Egbenema bharatensis]|uniref:helix-turn-helix domain-containing protein n=1 Tax=Egbenema bharatensis TaxID=3463334 RepID=UPI003A85A620
MGSEQFFSLTSQDIDEIPTVLSEWKMEWRQLSRGCFHGQLKFSQFESIALFYISWNQAVQIQGISPPETIAFGIEISSQGQAIWRGFKYGNQDVLLSSNREIDLKVPAGYEMFIIAVKRDLFLKYADLQQCRLCSEDLQKSLGRANASALNAIKAYLQSNFALLEQDLDSKKIYPDAQSITQDVVSLLITVLLSMEDFSAQPSHSLQRMQLVKQLEQYMLAHLDQPLTIEQLCAVAGISERSLNNYFHDLLDMSPIAYFKALRLNRVRSALKLADPTIDRVASIAKQLGFQHMGYFSREYKAMFGESPSKTLWRSAY